MLHNDTVIPLEDGRVGRIIMFDILDGCLGQAISSLQALRDDSEKMAILSSVGDAIAECFHRDGRVLICGNGGSMADALHFAEEWTGRFKENRRPYAALALGEATHTSCVANDFGFEHVFSRQVEAFGRPGDVLILLTTSGRSGNLIEAALSARRREMTVVGFVGRGGGRLAAHCDILFDAPGKGSDRIQEVHMTMLHALIEAVEKELGH